MILLQQGVKDGLHFGRLAQLQNLQRLKFAQSASDRIGRVRQPPDLLVEHAIRRRPAARRQRHPPPLFQLEQQRAGRHVLDLAT